MEEVEIEIEIEIPFERNCGVSDDDLVFVLCCVLLCLGLRKVRFIISYLF